LLNSALEHQRNESNDTKNSISLVESRKEIDRVLDAFPEKASSINARMTGELQSESSGWRAEELRSRVPSL
jgi:hypothetical protein